MVVLLEFVHLLVSPVYLSRVLKVIDRLREVAQYELASATYLFFETELKLSHASECSEPHNVSFKKAAVSNHGEICGRDLETGLNVLVQVPIDAHEDDKSLNRTHWLPDLRCWPILKRDRVTYSR